MADELRDPKTCAGCDGTGWEVVPDKEPRTVRKCESCDYWDLLRGTAPGVPMDERKATLANYEPTGFNADALKHAGLFVQGVHSGIYVYGPVGTGKTRLACSILNDLWTARTARVRFIRVPELLIRLQPNMLTGDEADALIADLVNVPVLALDDVGANSGSDFSRRMIQTLADARGDRCHRTVWTSNLTLDDLGAFLGDERLPSRIAGSCRAVEVRGPDQRTLRKPKPAKAKPKTAREPNPKLGGSRW